MNPRMRALCVPIVALGVFLSCGGGSDLAGATGTGNPPVVTASLSVVADTAAPPVLGKRAALRLIDPREVLPFPLGPDGGFTIADDDGLPFTIDSALLLVSRITFVTAGECGLRSGSGYDPALECDSQGLSISGPFTFDLLRGTADPPLDSLVIPCGSYTGIRLHHGAAAGAAYLNKYADGPRGERSLYLAGSFLYNDTLRPFMMASGSGLGGVVLGGVHPMELDGDRAHFAVTLAVQGWLASVNLAGCLGSGELAIEPPHPLVLTTDVVAGPCIGLMHRIQENIVRSAVLGLFTWSTR